MIPFAANTGAVSGGWEYVIAAYVITWLFFVGYTVSLVARRHAYREDR